MTVCDLKSGELRTVTRCTDRRLEGKLLCLGVKPGCPICVIRKTNFDRTFYIKAADNRIAIRYQEAASIEVA